MSVLEKLCGRITQLIEKKTNKIANVCKQEWKKEKEEQHQKIYKRIGSNQNEFGSFNASIGLSIYFDHSKSILIKSDFFYVWSFRAQYRLCDTRARRDITMRYKINYIYCSLVAFVPGSCLLAYSMTLGCLEAVVLWATATWTVNQKPEFVNRNIDRL